MRSGEVYTTPLILAAQNARDELQRLAADEECDHDANICWCYTFKCIRELTLAIKQETERVRKQSEMDKKMAIFLGQAKET